MQTLISTVLSAALLCTVAAQASAQSNDSGRALVASNFLKLSADTEQCAYITPAKEFTVPHAGVVRVRWQLRSTGQTATAGVGSLIHGCSSTTGSMTYQAAQCDLRVREGDRVSVSAFGSQDINFFFFYPACIKDVRIYYNVVNATGVGRVITD